MANPPPTQQPISAPPPPNIHDPTANTNPPQPPQQLPTVPALPSLPQAQISPSHLDVNVPSRRTPSSAALSTTSTLTPSVVASAPAPPSETSSSKRSRTEPDVEFESPSPHKAYPDFSTRKSDENSLMSGDDSNGWEQEERAMEAMIAAQNAEEELQADMMPDLTVPVVADWELLAEDAEADAPAEGGTQEIQYETKTTKVKYTKAGKKWNKNQLYDLFLQLDIQGTSIKNNSNKRAVFDAIRDSNKVVKLNDDEFQFEEKIVPSHLQKGPRWKLLTGTEIVLPADNNVGPPRLTYLRDAPIKRPEFKPKPKKKKSDKDEGDNDADNDANDDTSTARGRRPKVNERGGPSDHVKSNLPKDFFDHRPKDYFDLQITPDFVDYIADSTNRRAVAEGAGTKTYKDWSPFDRKEIYKFFALLFANALSPKPQLVHWFLSSANSRLFGNDHFARLFDKRMVGGRVITGERRWNMFRRFMTLYDCREDPKKLQKEDP
eukprot:scaffold7734_cov39-Cyclotella_meneghiniana.AAC.1